MMNAIVESVVIGRYSDKLRSQNFLWGFARANSTWSHLQNRTLSRNVAVVTVNRALSRLLLQPETQATVPSFRCVLLPGSRVDSSHSKTVEWIKSCCPSPLSPWLLVTVRTLCTVIDCDCDALDSSALSLASWPHEMKSYTSLSLTYSVSIWLRESIVHYCETIHKAGKAELLVEAYHCGLCQGDAVLQRKDVRQDSSHQGGQSYPQRVCSRETILLAHLVTQIVWTYSHEQTQILCWWTSWGSPHC